MASFIRRIVVVSAAAFLAVGCGEDDPPAAVDYLLCAGVRPGGWIAVFDCRNDSLIDSLGYPGMLIPEELYASPDGEYVASLEAARPTRIWDMKSFAQAKELLGPEQLLFEPELEIVLAARIDTLKIYSFVDFSLDTLFMTSCRWPTALPGSDRALMLRFRGPRSAPPERSLFTILDMSDRLFVDSFVISDDLPSPMQVWTFDVSEDSRMLYAIGHDNIVPFVAGFSLSDRKLIFRTLLGSVYGHCRLSPDQRELWVTDPGPPPAIGPSWPGHVLIMDAMTGVILDTIHTRGLDGAYPDIRWRVDDIQFVPGSNKAYVNCLYRGPILVIDTRSKEITTYLLHDEGRSADGIVALPRY